jgi:nucleoid-associated protein YgaU
MYIAHRIGATGTLVIVTWLAWQLAAWNAAAAVAPRATVDDLVAAIASVGLVVVAGWVWASLIAHAAAALPGTVGRISAAAAAVMTPAACRGAIRLLLGATAISAPITPVAASAAEPAAYALATSSTAGSSAGFADLPGIERPAMVAGWVPTVPEPAPAAAPQIDVRLVATPPSEAEAMLDDVVVRRGDTLWEIAARALGKHATAAEIAAEWPRWYAANRAVIGADPDLIHPGTVLRAPTR